MHELKNGVDDTEDNEDVSNGSVELILFPNILDTISDKRSSGTHEKVPTIDLLMYISVLNNTSPGTKAEICWESSSEEELFLTQSSFTVKSDE